MDNRHWIEWLLGVGQRLYSPLLISGLVLLGLYAVLRNLLERVKFSKLTPGSSAAVLKKILQNVFVIALVTIVLSGVGYILPKIVPKDWLVPPPRLEYAVSVFRMLDPMQDPMARVLQSVELYPGFPYFSRESDDPSAWPPRVSADRVQLWNAYSSLFKDPEVQKRLASAPGFDPTAVKLFRNGPPDRTGEQQLAGFISSARSYLLPLLEKGGKRALITILGPAKAEQFLKTEQQREALRDYFPNRLAVVRIRNSGRSDIVNLGIELEVAGLVYDCVVDADPDKVRKSNCEGEAQRISFEQMPRGYTAQVRLWYQYESMSEKAFPDKINFIQELTQGVKIANIAASQAKVSCEPALLADLQGYERLYIGDARKKDSYDKELAALFKENSKKLVAEMKDYDAQHPTIKNIGVEKLGKVNVDDTQVTSIWLAFRSPAGKEYTAVHVFSHPTGPYVLLSSKDRDTADMKVVSAKIAQLYRGEPEADITDRTDDICLVIKVSKGFTQSAIAAASAELAAAGYTGLSVPSLNYDVKPEAAAP